MSQRCRFRVSSGVVVSVLFLVSALPAAGQARVSTIQEVIDGWSPETHLWVIGDVGLKDPVLAELEAWLEDRHWTVLLVQDATGQRFQDVDGMTREGVDALEYGTGQGITRAPGFAGQVHPETGEPDGVIFSIVLAQRALFYSGSRAQDSRGLGRAAFRGSLDQWAIAALRNNGDIVSAVRDTVTNVDVLLSQAIVGEREQAADFRAEARRRIEEAEAVVADVEKRAAALRAAPFHPRQGLALPDTITLGQELARVRRGVEEIPQEALTVAGEVLDRARLLQSQLEAYPEGAKVLAEAGARLARMRRHELAGEARAEIDHAAQTLAGAGKLYREANAGYVDHLDLASGALSNAEAAIRRAERRAELRKDFLVFLGFCLLGALAWFAWLLNRRRRPVKEEVEALLACWQTALDRKLEALFGELERRVERLAGPASGDQRFSGETAELVRQLRSDVGSLTILWTSASAVLEQAGERIRPRRLGRVLYNLFFPGNYLRGLGLLKDEPVPFDPAEGLPRLFGGERTWRDDLLGDLAGYEPFRKSFEELMEEFHARAGRAAGALDELEASLRELPLLVEKVHERIWQTGLQKDYLGEAGAEDGLFLVPAVFSEVLPAAEAALEEARGTASADPVGTRKGSGARAERLAADAWHLIGLCRGVRSAAMPALQSVEPRLREAGLRALSSRAAELASKAAKEAVSGDVERLAADLAAFQELTGRLPGTRSRIAAEAGRVESSRREMGAALGLAPDLLLRETGSDPSERLRAASLDAAAAEARLGRAEVEEAAQALESADRLAAEAAAIVDASREIFGARETAVEERRAETERLAALLPEHELVLAGTQEAFAESALSLGPGDEIHPGADGTVADNADEAREEIAAARGKLDLAVTGIREGRLLAAASLLGEVRSHQELAGFRLAEITAKRARLDRARRDNRGLLAGLVDRTAQLGRELLGDARITQPTLDAYEKAAGRVRAVRSWTEEGREDPLEAGRELLAAEAALDRVEDTLAPQDRELHRQAAKALAKAREAVEEAGSWSSAYGVEVLGQPGVNELSAAERLLREGRYEESRLAAEDARGTADAALEEARAEESRLRERERQESWQSSSSSSSWVSSSSASSFSSGSGSDTSSSWSGGGSDSGSGSSGWSGSDSGSGSSSWGGSDSGSGKSGW